MIVPIRASDEPGCVGDWILTYTGKRFYPLSPKPEDIVIEDIAHALSMMCRFTGHTKEFLSVAQHSVNVSIWCDPRYALYGLLHDASEAYLCDVARPIKRLPEMEEYRRIEKELQTKIYAKFGLCHSTPESVKRADLVMLKFEAEQFMKNIDGWGLEGIESSCLAIDSMAPKFAEKLFLQRFEQLTRGGMAA